MTSERQIAPGDEGLLIEQEKIDAFFGEWKCALMNLCNPSLIAHCWSDCVAAAAEMFPPLGRASLDSIRRQIQSIEAQQNLTLFSVPRLMEITRQKVELEAQSMMIVGDCFLRALHVCFLARLPWHARQSAAAEAQKVASKVGIPCSPGVSPFFYELNNEFYAKWCLANVPKNGIFEASALAIVHSWLYAPSRIPVILDPHDITLRWLKSLPSALPLAYDGTFDIPACLDSPLAGLTLIVHDLPGCMQRDALKVPKMNGNFRVVYLTNESHIPLWVDPAHHIIIDAIDPCNHELQQEYLHRIVELADDKLLRELESLETAEAKYSAEVSRGLRDEIAATSQAEHIVSERKVESNRRILLALQEQKVTVAQRFDVWKPLAALCCHCLIVANMCGGNKNSLQNFYKDLVHPSLRKFVSANREIVLSKVPKDSLLRLSTWAIATSTDSDKTPDSSDEGILACAHLYRDFFSKYGKRGVVACYHCVQQGSVPSHLLFEIVALMGGPASVDEVALEAEFRRLSAVLHSLALLSEGADASESAEKYSEWVLLCCQTQEKMSTMRNDVEELVCRSLWGLHPPRCTADDSTVDLQNFTVYIEGVTKLWEHLQNCISQFPKKRCALHSTHVSKVEATVSELNDEISALFSELSQCGDANAILENVPRVKELRGKANQCHSLSKSFGSSLSPDSAVLQLLERLCLPSR